MTAPYTAAELAAILVWHQKATGAPPGPDASGNRHGRHQYAVQQCFEAVPRLVAELTRAREALRKAAIQFRAYETGHSLKGSSDKASRNRDFAELCERALGDAFAEATASKEEPADLSRRSSEGA